jgi:hypothetical protein
MTIEFVRGDDADDEPCGIADLMAAHQQALAVVARLGASLMESREDDAGLLGRRFDVAVADEEKIRQRIAKAPVHSAVEIKMKATYFKRLMRQEWCDLEESELRALVRSFADLPI